MTFTRQHDHVFCLCIGNNPGNGIAATGDKGDVLRRGETGTDIIEYLPGRFGTRVVVSDQNTVSQTLNHLRHQRTLAAVTVAAAAEQAQQLTFGMRRRASNTFSSASGVWA